MIDDLTPEDLSIVSRNRLQILAKVPMSARIFRLQNGILKDYRNEVNKEVSIYKGQNKGIKP